MFVRLTGSPTRSGGKLIPIGKSLEVGVDIPEALAQARLVAGTAEEVLGSAVSAAALRATWAAFGKVLRAEFDARDKAVADAADADLPELLSGALDLPVEIREAGEEVLTALDRHRAAIEAEWNGLTFPDPTGGSGGSLPPSGEATETPPASAGDAEGADANPAPAQGDATAPEGDAGTSGQTDNPPELGASGDAGGGLPPPVDPAAPPAPDANTGVAAGGEEAAAPPKRKRGRGQ